jgi:peroxiredoxin Q/BCP
MFKIGKKPKLSFKIEAVLNGKATELPFSDLIEGPTVVSVYMRNNTSACDKQTCSLKEDLQVIVRKGFKVIAVSRDKLSSHLKYADKNGIKYTLVSDPEDKFSKALDAIVEKSMYGKKYFGPLRAAYLFDEDGVLKSVITKIEPTEHGQQVLSEIKRLESE